MQNLRDFIALNPGRIESLVRAPFEIERGETSLLSTMRMPPFMRQSNAEPLTLTNWQYQLLMQWVPSANAASQAVALSMPAPAPFDVAVADERRTAVLARLAAGTSIA